MKLKKQIEIYYFERELVGLNNEYYSLLDEDERVLFKAYKISMVNGGYTYRFENHINKTKSNHIVGHRRFNPEHKLTFSFDRTEILSLLENKGVALSYKKKTGSVKLINIEFGEEQAAEVKCKASYDGWYTVKYNGSDLEQLFLALFAVSKLNM